MKPQINRNTRARPRRSAYTGAYRQRHAGFGQDGDRNGLTRAFWSRPAARGIFWPRFWNGKLRVVEARYAKVQLEYERYAVLAMSHRFTALTFCPITRGVPRAAVCRVRRGLHALVPRQGQSGLPRDRAYILKKTSFHGDALSLQTVGNVPAYCFCRVVTGQRQHDQTAGFCLSRTGQSCVHAGSAPVFGSGRRGLYPGAGQGLPTGAFFGARPCLW